MKKVIIVAVLSAGFVFPATVFGQDSLNGDDLDKQIRQTVQKLSTAQQFLLQIPDILAANAQLQAQLKELKAQLDTKNKSPGAPSSDKIK